ncbi:MAG: alanine racemase [Deltaproteobacteria bacterium]|nr:alanine racemase [Deltaproteobacteria bacterium]
MSPPVAHRASSVEPTVISEGRSLRVLRPRRAAPEAAVRPTRAEIDLSALRHNLRAIRRAAGQARVWSVLKADAYGHGAPAVARTLERAGVDGVAVALLEEGVELRSAGIRAPILVMGGYYGDAYEELLASDLVPVVYHEGHFDGLARATRTRGLSERVSVHIKVDTGMGRLGVSIDELPRLLDYAAGFPQITVDGLMTHFACADVAGDDGDASLAEQMAVFERAQAIVRAYGLAPRYVHAANSAALLRAGFDARLAAVRPGIALFGVAPLASEHRAPIDLHQTLKLRSEIVALRTVEEGAGIGYGSTWRAPRRSVIATVPFGYADGLPRSISERSADPARGRGEVIVRGKRAPIVGVLSMDLATIDVTDIAGARLRDEVVALGHQRGPLGESTITIEELARTAGLIPWDVMTSISRRVPRFYREP